MLFRPLTRDKFNEKSLRFNHILICEVILIYTETNMLVVKLAPVAFKDLMIH